VESTYAGQAISTLCIASPTSSSADILRFADLEAADAGKPVSAARDKLSFLRLRTRFATSRAPARTLSARAVVITSPTTRSICDANRSVWLAPLRPGTTHSGRRFWEDCTRTCGRQHDCCEAIGEHAAHYCRLRRTRGRGPSPGCAQRRARTEDRSPVKRSSSTPSLRSQPSRVRLAPGDASPNSRRKTPKACHPRIGRQNAPVVVFADADLAHALPIIASSALYNAGQDCTAATRILVEEPRI